MDLELMLDVGQANEFKLACRRAGYTNADIKKLCEGDTLAQFLPVLKGQANIVTTKHIVGNANEVFQVVVDYSQTLSDMIASGHYDWVNSDITKEHFPITGNGTVDLTPELIHFGKSMGTDNVLKDLDSRGLRPATLSELLAFGAKFPEKQREFPIIGLGSVWTFSDGHRRVPFLCEDVALRELSLYWDDGGWIGDGRFLAVRK